jgi:hypothetical protein
MVEILKRYGDRIKALERRDREGFGSGVRSHPRDPGPSNPVRGDVLEHPKPVKPEASPSDPVALPYLNLPSLHVSSPAVPMGTGVGPGQFASVMRASPQLPEGLQRALLAAVQSQQHEGLRGANTQGQEIGPASPHQSSQQAAPLVRRLYHDGTQGLYTTLGMVTQAMGAPYALQRGGIVTPSVYQPAPHVAEYTGGARGARHVGGSQGYQGFGGSSRYPSYMADVAQHFGPAGGAIPLGGLEGSAATDPRFDNPVDGASQRHSGVPTAAMQERGDRTGSRVGGLSSYLTGLHRALVQGDPVGPQGQQRPHTPPVSPAPAAVKDAGHSRPPSTRPPSRQTPQHSPRAGPVKERAFGTQDTAADAGTEDPVVPASEPPEPA